MTTISAYGKFTPVSEGRTFIYGPAPLAIGDLVRVTAYGYGASRQECGRTGRVTALHRSRATVVFPDHGVFRIGGTVLALLMPEPV
jgi:hypothetical protein